MIDHSVPVIADTEGSPAFAIYCSSQEEEENYIKEFTQQDNIDARYYVEVEWEDMLFSYDFGTVEKYDWDLDELKYKPVMKYANNSEAGWIKNTAEIRFTNRSNRPVYAGTVFTKNPDTDVYDKIEVSFDKNEIMLESAWGADEESPPQDVITLKVLGEPSILIDKENVPSLGHLNFLISPDPIYNNKPQKTVAKKDLDNDYDLIDGKDDDDKDDF